MIKLKKYIQFIDESMTKVSYPTLDEMNNYTQSIIDILTGYKLTIRYESGYQNYSGTLYSYPHNDNPMVGHMYKILSVNTISKIKRSEVLEEISHIATNIKLDYPNLDLYYYSRQQDQMVCLFLFDPNLAKPENIKNYSLVKL